MEEVGKERKNMVKVEIYGKGWVGKVEGCGFG